MRGISIADVDERIGDLVRVLRRTSQQLDEVGEERNRSEQQWRRDAENRTARVSQSAEAELQRSKERITTNAVQTEASAAAVVRSALEARAPKFLSVDWQNEIWRGLPVGATGEWLRVGLLKFGSQDFPVVLPMSAGVWTITGNTVEAFRPFVHNAITRIVAAFDPPSVRVIAFDPDLLLDLAVFANLRGIAPNSVPQAITSETEFEKSLEGLRTDISNVDDRLTATGQKSFWEAIASNQTMATTIPIRVLIVAASDFKLGERGTAVLTQLRRVASDRGLLVIELASSLPPNPSGSQLTVNLTSAKASASCLPKLEWVPDEWAGDSFIRALSAQLENRERQSLAPTVDFREIVADIEQPWMMDADEGLETSIGRCDNRDLVVQLRSENPPMPNALIGGAVGQGKSNLLHVLIHGLAAKYSPAELEMILVDLKDGVEFSRFAPTRTRRNWLPHVRAVGLEFDPDYSLAVLRWVEEKRTERSALFKGVGVQTLKQYHRQTGKVLPRLLVVIDEFQRLFEGDDQQASEAASMLEGIARTGRTYGFHLVLASQAITGIQGLATKADAIFGQFHNRITLRNTSSESQAFLAPHNLAATELEHRGEAVLNNALGSVDANTTGIVAYADPRYLDQLQAKLFSQGHGSSPSVFRASSFAKWPKRTETSSNSRGISVAVGMPIGVEPSPARVVLSRSPNQMLAVVGTNRSTAVSVLVRAVDTAVASLGRVARVIILDGDNRGPSPAPWVASLVHHLRSEGATVEHCSHDHIAAKVLRLGQKIDPADLVVAIALDSVDLSTPVEPDYLLPNDLLRDLVKSGPLHGTWTIGWWQSKSVLEEQLGYRAPGVRAWAFTGVSRDDLTDIAGHAVREPTISPRVVWFDRTDPSGSKRLVPFDSADLLGLADID